MCSPLLISVQLQPESTEEYIDYLVSIDKLDEAAIRLAGIINNEDFLSKKGKSKHQVGHNPLKSLNVSIHIFFRKQNQTSCFLILIG